MLDEDRPFLSVVVTTCRDDFPMKHKPSLHVLALIVENCLKQNFADFELIVVDLMWKKRKNYLEKNFSDMPFPILHIPDKSSIFRDLSLTRICSARNTALLYARGHCVVFSDDCQDWSENAFERLHAWGQNGHGATIRFFRDKGRGAYEDDSRWVAHGINGTLRTKVVPASGIGYMGGTLSMCPLENMLECNGWDEMFDGSRQLEDSDMAKRLEVTGLQMALEGHAQVTEHTHDACSGHIHRFGVTVKCNGTYIYPIWKAQPERVVANDRVLTDGEIDLFMPGECPILKPGGKCGTSGDKCESQWKRRSLMNIYKDQRLVFDLRELRKTRSWESAAHDPLLQV